MNILEFKKDIKNNKLKPFYVISGEEIGIISFFLNEIKTPAKRVESVASVWKQLTSKQMFDSGGTTYIVRDDDQFIKNEKAWTNISEKVKYGTLIILVTKVDKTRVFYKKNKDYWIEFERQSEQQLIKYFDKRYAGYYSTEMIEYVVRLCNRDFDRISNELDKITCYFKSDVPKSTEHDVKVAADNLIHQEVEFNIFDVVNAVLSKQEHFAMEAVEVLLARGESTIGVLTMLYKNFINAAKILGSNNPTEKALGIKGFQIGLIKKNFRYSLDSAFEGAKLLDEAIEGIKNGVYDESMAIRLTLFQIFDLR